MVFAINELHTKIKGYYIKNNFIGVLQEVKKANITDAIEYLSKSQCGKTNIV